MSVTHEMEQFFIKRTAEHIERVKQNLIVMEGYLSCSLEELLERAKVHDQSKYEAPERIGYIWLTWLHRCKSLGIQFEYPAGVSELVEEAVEHHVRHNLHHPEAHKEHDAMSNLDVVEMVCDWTAISQEFNQPSCKHFVNANIDKKWLFSEQKKAFIYKVIEEMDKRNNVWQKF